MDGFIIVILGQKLASLGYDFYYRRLANYEQNMKTTSFARESGFQSSGGNLWNLAKRHKGRKMHIVNHTADQLLGNVDVAFALDEARRRQVEQHNKNANKYSRMVKHHIDAVVFLSAQGIAFRGHDESKLSSNRGNFIERPDLIGHYSSELEGFLEEKITYTSHEPQNDFVECVYEEVKCEIQKSIDNSKFVALMMDDTSDVSGVEQSAVSVRLINNWEVEEHLLGIIDCSKDTTASALTDILLTELQDFKITPENGREKLIGQSYDGAATMSGELNGVQRRVQDKFPAAYYNHCVAHRLSLCASQTANQIPENYGEIAECIGVRYNSGEGKGMKLSIDYRLMGNLTYLNNWRKELIQLKKLLPETCALKNITAIDKSIS
eukprot:gene2083-2361_t